MSESAGRRTILRLRLVSASIAASIALAWSAAAAVAGGDEWVELSLAAALVVLVLGWLLGAWARSTAVGPVVTMAILAVPLTALAWILVFLVPTGVGDLTIDGLLALPLVVLYSWLIGLALYGLPGLLLALPSACLWLLLYRLVSARLGQRAQVDPPAAIG